MATATLAQIGEGTAMLPQIIELLRQREMQSDGAGSTVESTHPGGHLKLLHLWPGQNPPPGSGGTRDDYAV